MKNCVIMLILATIALGACKQNNQKITENQMNMVDSLDKNNNFYDNVESYSLPVKELTITGEVSKTGKVDFSKLEKHTVIVKEAVLSGDSNKFVGAYRYDGYSLFDILNEYLPEKLNKSEFPPIIDLYVEIENDKGEKVVLSWGEIYYPTHLHEIIIASDVRRIVPSKTKDLWPLPTDSKLVVSSDLLTERNISNPVKITVHSYPKSFKTQKGMSPCFSPNMDIAVNDTVVKTLDQNPSDLPVQNFHTIFYGRGRGIHSTTPFKGVKLCDVLQPITTFNQEMLKTGIVVVTGIDGYRSVYTYSELMNRNDQAEVLLVCDKAATDNGIFRVFPACDFFSDRAVKAVNKVFVEKVK